jgi:hypothetical protein
MPYCAVGARFRQQSVTWIVKMSLSRLGLVIVQQKLAFSEPIMHVILVLLYRWSADYRKFETYFMMVCRYYLTESVS